MLSLEWERNMTLLSFSIESCPELHKIINKTRSYYKVVFVRVSWKGFSFLQGKWSMFYSEKFLLQLFRVVTNTNIIYLCIKYIKRDMNLTMRTFDYKLRLFMG